MSANLQNSAVALSCDTLAFPVTHSCPATQFPPYSLPLLSHLQMEFQEASGQLVLIPEPLPSGFWDLFFVYLLSDNIAERPGLRASFRAPGWSSALLSHLAFVEGSSTGTCLRPPLTVGLLGVASPSASSAGLSDSTFLMFTSSLWNDPAAHSPASCLCVERAGEKGGLCSGLRAARGWCPHARPLPKMPLSCLKAGPHRAAAAPRFMGISGLACDSILTAVTHSLAHLKRSEERR